MLTKCSGLLCYSIILEQYFLFSATEDDDYKAGCEDVLRPAHRVESETRPWQAVDTQGGRCDAGAALAVRGQSVVEDSKRGRQRQGRPCREEKMGEPREVEGGEEGGSNNATLTSGSR
jgi:hypothetical protein